MELIEKQIVSVVFQLLAGYGQQDWVCLPVPECRNLQLNISNTNQLALVWSLLKFISFFWQFLTIERPKTFVMVSSRQNDKNWQKRDHYHHNCVVEAINVFCPKMGQKKGHFILFPLKNNVTVAKCKTSLGVRCFFQKNSTIGVCVSSE